MMTSTVCGACGAIHHLGGTDCDGEPVGYLEPGVAYADRAERDRAVGCGHLADAYGTYNRTGGLLGPEPDVHAILRAADVLPEHYDDVLDSWRWHQHIMRLTAPVRDQRTYRWN